jgi:hypothetical protein
LRFFSKIVTFCNIAFLLSAVLRVVNFTSTVKGNPNTVEQTNIFVSTILILAVFAIFLNIIFIICLIVFKLLKIELSIAKVLVLFNVLMLPLQIWYYFYSKI